MLVHISMNECREICVRQYEYISYYYKQCVKTPTAENTGYTQLIFFNNKDASSGSADGKQNITIHFFCPDIRHGG